MTTHVLHTENLSGNLHDAATVINRRGWADYVVAMEYNTGHHTVVVYRMPAEMVFEIRRADPSYWAEPDHDFPEGWQEVPHE